MKNGTPNINKLNSISDIHSVAGLSGPMHPMITIIDAIELLDLCKNPIKYVLGFYKITLITKMDGKFRYGQGHYDFDEGSMVFAAPNQIVGHIETDQGNQGVSLFIHPDFLNGYSLASTIKKMGFFSYAANEALHLSEKESETIQAIYTIISEELNSRIDDFSQEVIIAQVELLLSYAKRFYKRQFLTRKIVTNNILQEFESILEQYFDGEKSVNNGIPTVQYFAEVLNYSPNYLSDMLRSLTGLNAQQHIHDKLIEKAKNLLSTTDLSINEIAFHLGFDYPQSFSRLFKMKTNQSPVKFRLKFN